MIRERNRALVYVPDEEMSKLAAHGLVLPDGYRVLDRAPERNVETMSTIFVVEGPADEIPYSAPGAVLPALFTLPGYSAIVVERPT